MKAAKKAVSKKVAPTRKKRAAKIGKAKSKMAVKKKAAAKKKSQARVPGYTPSEGGVLVPNNLAEPVPTSKLKLGFARAKKEINSLAEEIISTMNDEFIISEIELSASFSADG